MAGIYIISVGKRRTRIVASSEITAVFAVEEFNARFRSANAVAEVVAERPVRSKSEIFNARRILLLLS